MNSETLVRQDKAMLSSLIHGFIVALGLEITSQILAVLGYVKPFFLGFILVVFWPVYSNYYYCIRAENTILRDMVVSIVFGLYFAGIAWLVSLMQGFVSISFYGYILGLSLLMFWAARMATARRKR